jgi:hypothetical protein
MTFGLESIVKKRALKDVIGKRGENIVELCLTEYTNFPAFDDSSVGCHVSGSSDAQTGSWSGGLRRCAPKFLFADQPPEAGG